MKILILTHNISVGGAATACRRLIAAFRSQGVNVELLSIKEKKSSNLLVRKLYEFYSGLLSKLDIQICKYLCHGSEHWKSSGLIGVINARTIKSKNPTAINIHWIGHATISLRQLKKLDIPIVITMHDEWWLNALNHYRVETEFQKNSFARNAIINFVIKQKIQLLGRTNVALVCPSQELREMTIGAIPTRANNVHVIPNPVPSKIFYPDPNTRFNHRKLLFAGGTQDPRKGYDLLVDALRNMKEECTVTVLGMTGVETTGINQQIKIIGKPWVTSEPEMNRIYGESSLTVVPSRQEAFGQVACESIMSGTPVASFEVGGLQDIILDGFNGLKVEKFNTTKMAKKLDQFLRTDSVNHSLIAADAKFKYSEKTVINSYLKILE